MDCFVRRYLYTIYSALRSCNDTIYCVLRSKKNQRLPSDLLPISQDWFNVPSGFNELTHIRLDFAIGIM